MKFRASVVFVAALLALPLVSVSVPAAGAAAPVSLKAGGSVDEAWLTGAGPGDQIALYRHGAAVSGMTGAADDLGSLILRNLAPGGSYTWHDLTSGAVSTAFSVLAPGADPATNSPLYTNQPLHQGLNYITVRDGIKLAATVRYPYGGTCSASHPCPTVIEYSGYDTAAPTDPIPSLLAKATGATCTATSCGDANLLPDTATAVGSVLARVAGFATVSLQMRGTGCSGGAFDLFGYPSDYDAYDVIETVAHQSWVAHHHVGMVGISFSGLSEFPSAGTDPPGLAAIAPMSPTDDLFSTGYPGGIYNNGFAASWISQRIDDSKPAAALTGGRLTPLSATPVANVGQPWVYYEMAAEQADTGSSTCLSNQALHGQSESLTSLVGAATVAPTTGIGRQPSLFDRRSMTQWATKIKVPVFVSGALQDEQTGPQWAALINAIPKSVPHFANMVNGGHIDSTDPQTMSRWLEFLDLYVADKVPTAPTALENLVLGGFTNFASGISGQLPLPALRFTHVASPAGGRAAFAARTPLVRVLFDSGASRAGVGLPVSTYTASFTQWPPAGTVRSLALGTSGVLGSLPSNASSSSLTLDSSVRPATTLPTGNPWSAQPAWQWLPVPAADGLGFTSPPFAKTTTIVGPATLDLWVKSTTPVLDFQATITEVRPSAGAGSTTGAASTMPEEEYVTSGFLRSDNQVEKSDSTALYTHPTYLTRDQKMLSATTYRLVRIPIDPIVHTFRPGTRLRVVISAPGGDRPAWTFATLDSGQSATVGLGGATPSALVVNIVSGVQATAALPACGTLRGEPCRSYVPEGNGG